MLKLALMMVLAPVVAFSDRHSLRLQLLSLELRTKFPVVLTDKRDSNSYSSWDNLSSPQRVRTTCPADRRLTPANSLIRKDKYNLVLAPRLHRLGQEPGGYVSAFEGL